MRLTKRLRAIVDMCPPLEDYADIGCDHGRVAAALMLENRAKSVTATDISEKSLDKARSLAKAVGVYGNMKFIAGDGLAPVSGAGIKGAVVCGMGAQLMTDIFSADINTFSAFELLVLSPNKYPERLRAFVYAHGFAIAKERMINERGKYYFVIQARKGVEPPYTEQELLIGRHTLPDGDFIGYLEHKLGFWQNVKGAQSAERLAAIYEEGLLWARQERERLICTEL